MLPERHIKSVKHGDAFKPYTRTSKEKEINNVRSHEKKSSKSNARSIILIDPLPFAKAESSRTTSAAKSATPVKSVNKKNSSLNSKAKQHLNRKSSSPECAKPKFEECPKQSLKSSKSKHESSPEHRIESSKHKHVIDPEICHKTSKSVRKESMEVTTARRSKNSESHTTKNRGSRNKDIAKKVKKHSCKNHCKDEKCKKHKRDKKKISTKNKHFAEKEAETNSPEESRPQPLNAELDNILEFLSRCENKHDEIVSVMNNEIEHCEKKTAVYESQVTYEREVKERREVSLKGSQSDQELILENEFKRVANEASNMITSQTVVISKTPDIYGVLSSKDEAVSIPETISELTNDHVLETIDTLPILSYKVPSLEVSTNSCTTPLNSKEHMFPLSTKDSSPETATSNEESRSTEPTNDILTAGTLNLLSNDDATYRDPTDDIISEVSENIPVTVNEKLISAQPIKDGLSETTSLPNFAMEIIDMGETFSSSPNQLEDKLNKRPVNENIEQTIEKMDVNKLEEYGISIEPLQKNTMGPEKCQLDSNISAPTQNPRRPVGNCQCNCHDSWFKKLRKYKYTYLILSKMVETAMQTDGKGGFLPPDIPTSGWQACLTSLSGLDNLIERRKLNEGELAVAGDALKSNSLFQTLVRAKNDIRSVISLMKYVGPHSDNQASKTETQTGGQLSSKFGDLAAGVQDPTTLLQEPGLVQPFAKNSMPQKKVNTKPIERLNSFDRKINAPMWKPQLPKFNYPLQNRSQQQCDVQTVPKDSSTINANNNVQSANAMGRQDSGLASHPVFNLTPNPISQLLQEKLLSKSKSSFLSGNTINTGTLLQNHIISSHEPMYYKETHNLVNNGYAHPQNNHALVYDYNQISLNQQHEIASRQHGMQLNHSNGVRNETYVLNKGHNTFPSKMSTGKNTSLQNQSVPVTNPARAYVTHPNIPPHLNPKYPNGVYQLPSLPNSEGQSTGPTSPQIHHKLLPNNFANHQAPINQLSPGAGQNLPFHQPILSQTSNNQCHLSLAPFQKTQNTPKYHTTEMMSVSGAIPQNEPVRTQYNPMTSQNLHAPVERTQNTGRFMYGSIQNQE